MFKFDAKGPLPTLDLLLYGEEIVREKYASFSVPMPEHNWIKRAFSLARNYDPNTPLTPDMASAFSTCWEAGAGLKGLDESEDVEICREKLRLLMKNSGTIAQDVLFELSMISNIKRAGLGVRLGSANPDILVLDGSTNYYIECKHISTQGKNALQRNVRAASNQLTKHLPDKTLGVIAISITDYLFREPALLNAQDETGIHQQITAKLADFIRNEVHTWRNLRVVNQRVAGIIFYISPLMNTKNLEVPTQLAYIALADTITTGKSLPTFMQFYNSFRPLHQASNGRSITDGKQEIFVTD